MEILQDQTLHTLQHIIHGLDVGQCSLKALGVFLGGNWVVLILLLGPAPSGEWFCYTHTHDEEWGQLSHALVIGVHYHKAHKGQS